MGFILTVITIMLTLDGLWLIQSDRLLRTVRGGEDARTFVPHISVTVAVALAVLGVAVLIYFVLPRRG